MTQHLYDSSLEHVFNAAVPALSAAKAELPAPLIGASLILVDTCLAVAFSGFALTQVTAFAAVLVSAAILLAAASK